MPSPARDFKDPKWLRCRWRVLRRDKNCCRWCKKTSQIGQKRGGGRSKNAYKLKLQIHHIKTWADAPLLRFEDSNLITLCYDCHQKVWGKEREYEMFFKNLLRETGGGMDGLLSLLEKRYKDEEENGQDEK